MGTDLVPRRTAAWLAGPPRFQSRRRIVPRINGCPGKGVRHAELHRREFQDESCGFTHAGVTAAPEHLAGGANPEDDLVEGRVPLRDGQRGSALFRKKTGNFQGTFARKHGTAEARSPRYYGRESARQQKQDRPGRRESPRNRSLTAAAGTCRRVLRQKRRVRQVIEIGRASASATASALRMVTYRTDARIYWVPFLQ